MSARPLRVAVVGLGKIGLPLAVQFASKGAQVCGYDISAARVDEVNARTQSDRRLSRASTRCCRRFVADGRVRATTDARAAVARCRRRGAHRAR